MRPVAQDPPPAVHPLLLEFEADALEAAYRRHVFVDEVQPKLRPVMALITVTVLAFVGVDVLVVQDVMTTALPLRLGLNVLPWAVMTLLSDRSWFGRRTFEAWSFWGTGLFVVVMVTLALVADAPGSWLYLNYVAVFPLVSGAAARWRVRRTIAFNALTLVAAMVTLAMLDVDRAVAVFTAVIHVVVAFWGLVVARLIEGVRRTSYLQQLEIGRERQRADELLRNVLPSAIAERLKDGEEPIADRAEATVLFADLVEFTRVSRLMPPSALVRYLDDLFRRFDRLTVAAGLTKIKTVGDTYMVAGGIADGRTDHATAVVRLGLDLLDEVERFADSVEHPVDVRLGVHTGPVVAGVVGTHRFAYDIWGDTVNVAARLESHGVPAALHVSEQVQRALVDDGLDAHVEARGPVELRGLGERQTYLVTRTGYGRKVTG